MFEGVLTALVTPFRDGEIDEAALRALVERQIEAGIDGLVPCGSTGESATLSHAEHRRVVEIVVHATRGRVPVVAGTGSNNTREAIELTLHAKEAGADGALLISPYYNKPTQEGLYLHYAEIARRTAFPLVLYNIPGRTASNMLPATIARLADLEQVVGIKEACGDLAQISEVIDRCPDELQRAVGRRRAHAADARDRRQGRDLDHRERRARRDGVARALVPRGRRRHRAPLPPAPAPALRRAVRGDQPDPGQGGAPARSARSAPRSGCRSRRSPSRTASGSQVVLKELGLVG